MIIVYGTRTMKKNIGTTQIYTCEKCNNVNPYQVVRVRRWFTIYWIPLFPFSSNYFITCPICGHGISLPKDQALAATAQVVESRE